MNTNNDNTASYISTKINIDNVQNLTVLNSKGITGSIGTVGLKGSTGPIGYTGILGLTGPNGVTGQIGVTGNFGPTGTQGFNGPNGPTGPTGLAGDFVGSKGPTGPTGLDGGNASSTESVLIWNTVSQPRVGVSTDFQYVQFNQPIIGPVGNGWTGGVQAGYTFPTNFVVPETGTYQISYNMDVRPGTSGDQNASGSALLTRNGAIINGSISIVEAPLTQHIYAILNTVNVNLIKGDVIRLMFWARNTTGVTIGEPGSLTGLLPPNPPGTGVTESVCSLVITRLI